MGGWGGYPTTSPVILFPQPPLNHSYPSIRTFPHGITPHHPSSPLITPLYPSYPSSLRAVPGIYYQEGAVEVMTVYFEDSRVNSGIANMGIRKALWPMVRGGGG